MDPRAYLRLIGLGALVGIPAALLAAGFLALVHEATNWLWDDLPDALGYSSPPWFLVVFLPAVGACVVLVARKLLPGDGGHSPLAGLAGGAVPVANAPGIALAALGTLCFGAVLGPEGPLIALGAAAGVAITHVVKVGEKEQAVVATAGSFSAISALFGGPLVGGVLMVEAAVGFGANTIPILLPGFVAAAIGYTIFVGFGDWGGLDAQSIAVPGLPTYDGVHPGDLLIAVVVGVLAALLISFMRRIGHEIADRGEARRGWEWLLIAGGLAVGLIAQLADVLGAKSQDVLFSGQEGVPDELAASSAKVLIILLVAKGLAYAISLGCGFRGGPVFPAIFLGVAMGSLCIVWFDISPTLALAIGTAAGVAATTRLLLTASLFAALLVGPAGTDTVPAAVIAASSAWLVSTALARRAEVAGGGDQHVEHALG